jgi:hypothetical protein
MKVFEEDDLRSRDIEFARGLLVGEGETSWM